MLFSNPILVFAADLDDAAMLGDQGWTEEGYEVLDMALAAAEALPPDLAGLVYAYRVALMRFANRYCVESAHPGLFEALPSQRNDAISRETH